MKEIIIGENEKNQRLDRFLFKYMDKAPRSFIFKMIRKKNITVNSKKSELDYILQDGDLIKLYLSEDTINKFSSKREIVDKDLTKQLDIVYEDSDIIIVNKEIGTLSHRDGSKNPNLVDSIVKYVIEKNLYDPEENPTFSPSIANRLDRNTSGLVLGALTYRGIQGLNRAMRENLINRYYLTIVDGVIDEEIIDKKYISRDKQTSYIKEEAGLDSSKIVTRFRPLKNNGEYTLLEVELITGRTHQIRSHLNFLKHPIIGDRRYGNKRINKIMLDKFNLRHQLLHSYKLEFDEIPCLKNLSKRKFKGDISDKFLEIEKYLFRS